MLCSSLSPVLSLRCGSAEHDVTRREYLIPSNKHVDVIVGFAGLLPSILQPKIEQDRSRRRAEGIISISSLWNKRVSSRLVASKRHRNLISFVLKHGEAMHDDPCRNALWNATVQVWDPGSALEPSVVHWRLSNYDSLPCVSPCLFEPVSFAGPVLQRPLRAVWMFDESPFLLPSLVCRTWLEVMLSDHRGDT